MLATIWGLYIIGPFYLEQPEVGPVSKAFEGQDVATKIIGSFLFLFPGLYGLWAVKFGSKAKIALAAFWLCLSYVFIASITAINEGILPPGFLSHLVLGLIAGACYVVIKVENK